MDATFSATVRRSPTTVELDNLTNYEVEIFVSAGTPFSAWDVTKSLREANPGVDLAIGDVKWRVRREMNKVLQTGEWTSQNVGYWLYSPVLPADADAEVDASAVVDVNAIS